MYYESDKLCLVLILSEKKPPSFDVLIHHITDRPYSIIIPHRHYYSCPSFLVIIHHIPDHHSLLSLAIILLQIGMNERVAVPVTTIAAVYNSRRQKKVAPTIPSSLVTAITHHHQTTIDHHH
jgi:hypothetical protein